MNGDKRKEARAEDIYGDIINLPRPASSHPKMGRAERAAQFSAFAALSGHSEAIGEAERLAGEKADSENN